MRIPRDALQAAFQAFANAGNGVVLGHPGAGKTHTVSAFCDKLIAENQPCLYIPIDKLGIETVGELSQSLGIPADIPAYLSRERSASQDSPGFFVVDGFDAARSDKTQRQLMGLIQQVVNRLSATWRIIVSVRTYDASKSVDLLRLFSAAEHASVPPPEYHLPGVGCRHFHVPLLSQKEVDAAAETIAGLPDLLRNASDYFRALTRTPFNIWLLEQLLSDPALIDELSTVRSEIELLTMFWRERVDKGPHAESRTVLASRIAERMVTEHSLSCRKDQVFEFTQEDAWHDLLSASILEEVGRQKQRVGFSHNILFDYAVSALLIEDTPVDFERFVSADPSRPLFLRPSLNYFFTRLWFTQPNSFWNILWHILPSEKVHMRLFARLLPTAVVANELRRSDELQPLLEQRSQDRELGDEAILRLLQAFRALNIERDAVWCSILHELSLDLSPSFVADLATCLSGIFDRAKNSQDSALVASCGSTARNVLAWVWQQRGDVEGKRFDRLGSGWILPIIAQSFSSAPQESRRILEPILEIVREKGFPIDFLYRLTHELNHIVTSDPEFVGMVYRAVFENPETSEEKTEMGTPILPMSSTRRQDYQMCHFNLKEQFPAFVAAAPEVATVTAIHCLTPFILGSHVVPYLNEGAKLSDLVEVFAFRGKQAHFLADMSCIWGETSYPDEPLAIASALFEFLDEAAKDPGKAGIIEATLDIFRDHAMVGFFWAGLLDLGAQHADRFASPLFELCTAFPLQTGNDTIHELACFVEAAAPCFDPDQLRMLEESFIALPAKADEHHTRESLESRRNRLLARISRDQLQTDEGLAVMAELEAAKKIPDNEPLVKFTSESQPYDEKEWLTEQGADWKKEENASLHAFFAPLDGFVSEWRNKKPTFESVEAIAPTLRDAFALLHEDHGADKPVENSLWTKAGECAETMAKAFEDPGSDEFRLCRSVLLECSRHPEPQPDPEYDAKYEHASWSPAPRNEAAQGLPWIAVWAGDDTEVSSAIEALVSDQKPSVRFLVTSDLFRLRRHYEDLFWRLVEHVAEQETNRVVQQALCRTLTYVVSRDEVKTCRILDRLKAATLEAGEEAGLLDAYVGMVMWLCIVRENEWARTTADEFLTDPLRNSKVLRRSTFDALSYVTPANLKAGETHVHAKRASDWLERAIDAAAGDLRGLQDLTPDEITEDIQAAARDVYGVIDNVVTQFYFSSGLFKGSRNDQTVSAEDRGVFYHFIKPRLEQVIEVSDGEQGGVFFAGTAHHFMELLNGVLEYDPPGVLHMAYRLAAISKAGRYHLDSMAVSEVVKLVESTLANHRAEVGDGESLDDLLGLLDILAAEGWPEALRLVWRLDEVFR